MAALDFEASSDTALGNLEDADVFQVMRTGNLSALEILYQRYGEGVYRLALRILGNTQDAEDLTQEIFLEFWRKQGYDPARGTVIVFLLTMTRSRALNRIKKDRSGLYRLLHWQRDRSRPAKNVPFENATLEELSEQVKKALQALPDKQRLVLEMAYYDGLSQSEITQRLNIPMGTVKSQSRRGLLKLRQQLEDWIK
ncbi:MAG: sigma-70 family RNA polymerase sigma factor [Cyanobacteria bacterium P01_H01_bin.153]